MKKFSRFIFESYSFDANTMQAHFYYSFDNGEEVFEEIINFSGENFERLETINITREDNILNNFLFQLHLALGISYYKLFPTEILEVKSGYLKGEQIIFWEKFYKNGLGEFFITNDIDPEGLIQFKNISAGPSIEEHMILNNYIESSDKFLPGKNLLLWGGGKDSIVSHSLLKYTKKLDLFVFGKVDDIKKKTSIIADKKIFLVQRKLSHNLFKLNKEGYYNGHVPITGIIAFSTFVVSYLYGYSHIILSNEKSADEDNREWKGMKINHQYSKSLEFEKDIKQYLYYYMSRDIAYFSLLRGMYEYKIAEIFSKQKMFFQDFSSCNRNFVINQDLTNPLEGGGKKLWCCECEKCCFVFLILSAFLEEEKVLKIFGKNLFENKNLEIIFRELIGLENHKPFECVGTYDESLLSAKKAIKKYELLLGKNTKLPYILDTLKTEVYTICDEETEKKLEKSLLQVYQEDIIPEHFKTILPDNN